MLINAPRNSMPRAIGDNKNNIVIQLSVPVKIAAYYILWQNNSNMKSEKLSAIVFTEGNIAF
jgi:hypothetical protein